MPKKGKIKMVFQSLEERDRQLMAFVGGSYFIDKKNDLIVWLY